MNFKKILLVIGFIILIILLGLALYFVFFKPPVMEAPITEYAPGEVPGIGEGEAIIVEKIKEEELPWQEYFGDKISNIANGGLTAVHKITDVAVKGFNGSQYYDTEQQQFYRINDQGLPELLTDKKFYGVEEVSWTKKGDKAILEYPDGSNILYNFNTGEQITLPPELESFDFDTSGHKIVAAWMGDGDDNNWIVSSNDDGTGMFLVEELGDQAHNTDIGHSPDNQVVAMHRRYTGLNEQEVFPIGLHHENFRSFTVQGAGFTSKWSDNGSSLVYSTYNEQNSYNPNLWVTKGDTNQLGDIKVSLNVATWPEKCSFSGEDKVFCAVPQGLPRGAGIYPEIANKYPDNFYRIDLETGLKTLIASPIGEQGGYSAHNLIVSDDGSTLYFSDNGGNLQSILLE